MPYQLRSLESVAQLRAVAGPWDDLWQRSDVALPTVRAEIIALWVERFSRRQQFQGLVVQDGLQFVAALPLTSFRLNRFVECAALPGADWYPGSELLLDPSCDVPEAMDALARGLARLRWPLLWLQGIEYKSPYWQAWMAALEYIGLASDLSVHWDVGRIHIAGNWDDYFGARQGDFRRDLRRRGRKLESRGTLVYRTDDGAEGNLDDLLRRAFDVEMRSWKGGQGTAVLQSPREFEFFVAQSRRLAAWKQLLICTLELDGKPIAFEYGYLSKGVFFPHKISYDEAHAREAPAQVLRVRQLEDFWRRGDVHCVDYIGPISEAVSHWTKDSYPTARVIVSPPRATSRALLWGYQRLLPWLRRWKRNAQTDEAAPPTSVEPPKDLVTVPEKVGAG